jgi:hypothetical protein
MAAITKRGKTQTAGAAFCLQCGRGVPTTTPFAVEVEGGYVHGRCKAAWDEAHQTMDSTKQSISPTLVEALRLLTHHGLIKWTVLGGKATATVTFDLTDLGDRFFTFASSHNPKTSYVGEDSKAFTDAVRLTAKHHDAVAGQ